MTELPADDLPEVAPIVDRSDALVHLVNAATSPPAAASSTVRALALLLGEHRGLDGRPAGPDVEASVASLLGACLDVDQALALPAAVSLLRVLDVDLDELAELGLDLDELDELSVEP